MKGNALKGRYSQFRIFARHRGHPLRKGPILQEIITAQAQACAQEERNEMPRMIVKAPAQLDALLES